MKRAAEVALAVLLLSVAIALPTTGFDALRVPVAALAAVVVVAAGARVEGTGWHRATALAWMGLLAAHLFSWLAAEDRWAAVLATLPVAVGFTVFTAISRGWAALDRLPWILAAAALFVGGMSVAGHVHRPMLTWALGNTNYTGGFCALLAVVFVALAVSDRRHLAASVVGLVPALAGLFFSGSRGGLVGLGAGLLVVALAWRGPKTARIAVAALLVAGGAGLAVKFLSGADDSRDQRFELWKGSARLAAARAVAGAGAGNFQGVYPRYRLESEARIAMKNDPRFREAEDPHNTHLSIACETGLPGLIAWLALLGFAAAAAWKRREPLDVAALAGIATLASAGMFNTLTGFTPFDVMLGLFTGLAARGAAASASSRFACGAGMVAGLGAAVVAFLAAGAEHTFRSVKPASTEFDRLPVFEKALDWWPPHYQAKLELANDYSSLAAYADEKDAPAFYRRAIELYEAARAQRPWNLQALASEAAARAKVHQVPAARELLDTAVRVAPWHHLAYYHRAFLDRDQTRHLLEMAVQREPRHRESYYFLGVALLLEDRIPEAVEAFRRARQLHYDVRGSLPANLREMMSGEQWARIEKD